MPDPPTADTIRLDRWLWAARFYKTRTTAAAAIDGGKVQVNGSRVKRSQLVRTTDRLRIRKPPFEFVVEIRALADQRRSAALAETLYEETSDSRARRQQLREQLRAQQHVAYDGKGRPTKKDRRQLDGLKESW